MRSISKPSRARCRIGPKHLIFSTLSLWMLFPTTDAIHHMKRPPMHYVEQQGDARPLTITNQCPEAIWPAIGTQAGTPPSTQGFMLGVGETMNLMVGAGWQGRVWGRTNCSFDAQGTGPGNTGGLNGGGQSCVTGDCNGLLDCVVTGDTPVTLAEFTLATPSAQTFYDISLVDGYNLPVGIVSLYPQSGNSSLQEIPPNLTNPVCIGTASLLAAPGSGLDTTLGTNSSFPIPLEETQTVASVQGWCPWDLQLLIPARPGDGVYPYPDSSIPRPDFDPCYSACAKTNDPADCCTGSYDNPNVCKPSLYSMDAKAVCPDAYSYAFDDQTSTFIIPSGGGFQVIFCPPGRSTNILKVLGPELVQLAQTGHVTPQILSDASNITLIRLRNGSSKLTGEFAVYWALAVTAFLSLLSAQSF